MTATPSHKLGITLAGVLALIVLPAHAALDYFGTTGNEFAIDFVTIGNPGNADDAGAGGGSYSSPYGGVSYAYRMGTYEISQDAITKATASGLANVTAGAWTGNQPAANMTWYEAAAFVNWLNTSTGHQAAYNLSQIPPDGSGNTWSMTLWSSGQAWQTDGQNLYRHKDAYYFLPSEDEWYKAAFHKNDGVTANYWDYATASNTIPTAVGSGTGSGTAVHSRPAPPAAVNNDGGLSAYGTMGQDGNVWEWQESALTAPNNIESGDRVIRGGNWSASENFLRSSTRLSIPPFGGGNNVGFRVASADVGIGSIPEPSTAIFGFGISLIGVLRRRRGLALQPSAPALLQAHCFSFPTRLRSQGQQS